MNHVLSRPPLLFAVVVVPFALMLLVSGWRGAATEWLPVSYTAEIDPVAVPDPGDLEDEPMRGLMLRLPTSNDALLRGDGAGFYQAQPTTIPGLRRFGWEGGQYGIVRNQTRTPAGLVFTRLHQGLDIKPLYRDRRGEPLDTVRAVDDGVVVYTNRNANGSSYGRYLVMRHDWEGSDVYTLHAHLATIQPAHGARLAAGDAVGRMGYTGRGINLQRAHLHLEVALMLNRNYNRWHTAFYRGRNVHGLYMGRNLMGVDAAGLYLALHDNPYLTFSEFVRSQPVAYRLAIPGNRPLDILERYPWLADNGLSNEDAGSNGSWLISFTREGVPVHIERQEKRVSAPEVAYVSDVVRRGHLSTAGVLSRSGNTYTLTRNGLAYAALLATTSRDVPAWF